MSVEHDVKDFMSRTAPAEDKNLVDLRIALLEEEFYELLEALRWGDRRFIAKEVADLVYVAVGTDVALNIPFDDVWEIVHTANMSKFDTEEPEIRPDGKVLKGPGYKDPADAIAKVVKS